MTRRLVEVDAVMYAQLHFFECRSEIEIGRRVVARIAAKNDEQLDRTAVHLIDEFSEADAVRRQCERRNRRNRDAVVAECRVHLRYESVHLWRLRFAGDNNAGTVIGFEVADNCLDPILIVDLRYGPRTDPKIRRDDLSER